MERKYYQIIVAVLIFITVVLFVSISGVNIEIATEKIPQEPSRESIPFLIHWHPQLFIFINSNQTPIPADTGINETSQALIHTHDDSGVLHMEQPNPTNETLKLGYFFHNVWNKTLNSACIFEYCANATHELKMWVNGKADDSFDNLIMHDGDIILIIYAKSYSLIAQF